MKSHHSDGLTAVDVDVFLHGSVAVALREYVGGAHFGVDTILRLYDDIDGLPLGNKVHDGPRAGLSADVCGGSGGGSIWQHHVKL